MSLDKSSNSATKAKAHSNESPEGSIRTLPSRLKETLLSSDNSVLLVIVVVAIIGVFWFLLRDTGFMSSGNLLNIVRQTTAVSVMAAALVFVISTGEIDLSSASIPPLSGLVAAMMIEAGYSSVLAVAAALLIGMLVGLINGAITVLIGIPSFIVTLGMIGVLEGTSRLISNERAIGIADDSFRAIFGAGSVGPVPVLLIWTVAVGVIGTIVLRRTAYGRAILATGGNELAARYSGIRTRAVKASALVVSGFAGGLAGLLFAGQLGSARYDLGGGTLLTVLAAVIIGGTALSGGRGFVAGAIGGSILMGLVNNGVILLGFSTAQQQIFAGIIIVLAVSLSARKVHDRRRTR